MNLHPGQELSHYRIDRKIGEGGMGEVWAATDTRLNRSAAIKALPAALAADPERLGRFKREAQVLAALSHPNIAAIYGLEQVDAASYLALELVEGEDLSARIARGPLPADEVVEIALQIAAALEEAHEKGIVHRDLKPANIKLTPDGKVKVLDFGLAKALSGDPDGSSDSVDLTTSPTLTAMHGTKVGVILGTAGYMAPEQARGKRVDRRADIWAFGVVLFEMLTGKALFTGETVTDVIAQVVTADPDWERLPADTPPALRRVLRRCLQKDPRKRLRDVGDAALELAGGFEDGVAETAGRVEASASRRSGWLLGAAGLALGLILATVIAIAVRPSGGDASTTWLNLAPPDDVAFDFSRILELSPDGRRVVFVAVPQEGDEPVLWVRDLGSEDARPLEGTEGASQPFWSPDSRSIGYFAKRRLRRIGADGGPSTTLDDVGDQPRGGCWGDDDTILYGPDWSQPLYRIPAVGGDARAITRLSAERLELSHRWPHALPDGKHFLYYAVSTYPALNPENPSEADRSGLYIGSFDGGEPRLLQTVRSRAVYVDGYLLYVDDYVLTARPFDAGGLSFRGEPVPLAEDVTQSANALWGGALFSVSDTGRLLFVRGALESRARSRLVSYDRQGNELGAIGEVRSYNDLSLSPDDSRLAAAFGDPSDVWILDLARDVSTRFTFDPGDDQSPVWSGDGTQVIFSSSRLVPGQRFTPGNLFRRAASGAGQEEHLTAIEHRPGVNPSAWSADGSRLALTASSPGTGADILFYSLESGEIEPYLETSANEQAGTFSPDGRWLAYASDESGRSEIYVAALSGSGGGKWQVSNGGGSMPSWRADGRELFFLTGDDGVMAAAVESGATFRHETPVELFAAPRIMRNGAKQTWDVASDGRRFFFLTPAEAEGAESARVTVVENWRGLLD